MLPARYSFARLAPSDGHLDYFVAGAGSMKDYLGRSASAAELKWSGTGYSAFAVLSASIDSLGIAFVNIYGELYFSASTICMNMWS